MEGKCYPITSVKCNRSLTSPTTISKDFRHVLVSENQAKSIVSDCGKKGKCVNGQCVLDRNLQPEKILNPQVALEFLVLMESFVAMGSALKLWIHSVWVMQIVGRQWSARVISVN